MTVDDVYAALMTVKDPEIPTISIVDMGIVTDVAVSEDGDVHVAMTPTFVGCPAIDVMRRDAQAAVEQAGARNVTVDVTFDTPWNTNRLTEAGRAALLKHGLAPPVEYDTVLDLTVLNNAACPYCNSRNTTLKSIFGPTLCRSLHYCNNCLQAFESFKPV
ncbi:MAG: phenylacetate-CoA oxygenase subunit PaaJ [Candidatus Kapabacteria bacterium]|nr:phenylacetate-CoA oxygenase subunit PaaJ [Candidatus Kapabacteria bacterium]